MDITQFLNRVIPDKWLKEEVEPIDFVMAIRELNPEATDETRFIGVSNPNAAMSNNLPPQRYVTCLLSAKVSKGNSDRERIGGGVGVRRVLPETFFENRDQVIFRAVEGEIQKFLAASEQDKPNYLLKLGTTTFRRLNGKPVETTDNLGKPSNMFEITQKYLPGNFCEFDIPMGSLIIQIDADGKRTVQEAESIDQKTGEPIRDGNPAIVSSMSCFVMAGERPHEVVRRRLSSMALVTPIEKWEPSGQVEKKSAEVINKELAEADETKQGEAKAKTGS